MKELIKHLDHMCSIKEYSNYGGMQILRDASSVFMRVLEVESCNSSEFVVKLPLLKYFKVDPRHIFYEIKEELHRKFTAPSVYDLGFDKIVEEMIEFSKKSHVICPLYLSMPHYPDQEFYDDCGYLCSVIFNDDDSMTFNLSQEDSDIYGALPYNLLYSVMFACLIANITNRRLTVCNIDFMNPYIRKEDLPKIAKLLEVEPELDTCVIKIKNRIEGLREIEWDDLEVEIY